MQNIVQFKDFWEIGLSCYLIKKIVGALPSGEQLNICPPPGRAHDACPPQVKAHNNLPSPGKGKLSMLHGPLVPKADCALRDVHRNLLSVIEGWVIRAKT